MSYMTISSQEKHNFSLCSCFHAHPTTLLLKILGDQCMGGPPTSNLGGGPSPQSPLGLRPWSRSNTRASVFNSVCRPTCAPSDTQCPFGELLWLRHRQVTIIILAKSLAKSL